MANMAYRRPPLTDSSRAETLAGWLFRAFRLALGGAIVLLFVAFAELVVDQYLPGWGRPVGIVVVLLYVVAAIANLIVAAVRAPANELSLRLVIPTESESIMDPREGRFEWHDVLFAQRLLREHRIAVMITGESPTEIPVVIYLEFEDGSWWPIQVHDYDKLRVELPMSAFASKLMERGRLVSGRVRIENGHERAASIEQDQIPVRGQNMAGAGVVTT